MDTWRFIESDESTTVQLGRLRGAGKLERGIVVVYSPCKAQKSISGDKRPRSSHEAMDQKIGFRR